MEIQTGEKVKAWQSHCGEPETAIATLQCLLKTCELALFCNELAQSEKAAVRYTLSMCNDLAEIIEENLGEIEEEKQVAPPKKTK